MAKKIITIGKKGVRERIEGSGPITNVNVDYPNGNQSSFAGIPFKDRPKPEPITKNSAPFSSFTGVMGIYNAETNQWFIEGPAPGDTVDLCLFTSDQPTIVNCYSNYSAPVFFGTTQLTSGGELRGFNSASPTVALPGTFTQNSPSIEFGARRNFESSNGIEFSGFYIRCSIADFGYLESSGGSPIEDPSTYVEVVANNSVPYGPQGFAIGGAGGESGVIGALVREDQLTQDMLDNPLQSWGFRDIPGRNQQAFICGVWAAWP